MRIQRNKQKRRGAAVVEMAAVAIVFLMVLFGIIEYGRFIFIRQLIYNAAREGARYAVVNTVQSSIVTDTQAKVQSYMGGFDTKLTNYNCSVYLADASGNNIGNAADANFGQYICVDVSCTFDPVLPSLIFGNQTFVIRSKTSMGSEAN